MCEGWRWWVLERGGEKGGGLLGNWEGWVGGIVLGVLME